MGLFIPSVLLWFTWAALAAYAGHRRWGWVLLVQTLLSAALLAGGIPGTGEVIFGTVIVLALPLAIGAIAYFDSARRMKDTRQAR